MTRRSLVWETRFMMAVFLVPAVATAVIVLTQGILGQAPSRFPVLVSNQFVNLVLGVLGYVPLAAVVPLALYLLNRTGQPPSSIGMGWFRFRDDILPGIGLAAASYGAEVVLLIPFSAIVRQVSKLSQQPSTGHVPPYYIIFGVIIAATTAVTEEVLVNGYLLTRLEQLGWTPNSALLLSLALRTSYHVYYGVGFLLTVPFGYFVTRSFQKHRRLNRAIAAHFIYDAVLFTISILVN